MTNHHGVEEPQLQAKLKGKTDLTRNVLKDLLTGDDVQPPSDKQKEIAINQSSFHSSIVSSKSRQQERSNSVEDPYAALKVPRSSFKAFEPI